LWREKLSKNNLTDMTNKWHHNILFKK